jgi:hypothetical protein
MIREKGSNPPFLSHNEVIEIGCGFKKCKCNDEINSNNSIKINKKIYHLQCKKDMDDMNKVCELYSKYYNDKESWAVMLKSLHNWYDKFSPEYMLFCISKAIRENKKMTNFLSIYYILNDLSYMERYKNLNKNYFTYDQVILSDTEYEELLVLMERNETKLLYYVRQLNDYINIHGKSYDSHYKVIESWYKKNEDSKPIEHKEVIL